MNRVAAASEKANERGAAAAGLPAGASTGLAGAIIKDRNARTMFVGTPITQDEVDEYIAAVTVNMAAMLDKSTLPLSVVLHGYLNHAVLTGLLAADGD